MSEPENGNPLERRLACDNCRARKTKCDRKSPCASCVTLNVACKTTRRAAERRQRVLISSKYEEAVQDVSQQLAEVKELLKTLVLNNESGSGLTGRTAQLSDSTTGPIIDEQLPSLSSVHEGYNGDSSFQSHAHKVKGILEATLAASELINMEAPLADSPKKARELPLEADTLDVVTSDDNSMKSSLTQSSHGMDPEKVSLPPTDVTLKLLRLSKTNRQRFFTDVPLFQVDMFVDMCRGVYFATEPISLWDWICVNVGLYFLFTGLSEGECRRIGTTSEAMLSHARILMANADATLQSLRLCSEPSVESCRALALLGTYYVKQGHSTIAWRVFSGAARAALDLGLNRLHSSAEGEERYKVSVFWHIYSWDKGLALTCGRAPIMHLYDVSTRGPTIQDLQGDIPRRLYASWIECAVISGEIQQNLFSASAQHAPPQVRHQLVKNFAARLKGLEETVRSATPDDPTWDDAFIVIAFVLDVTINSLLTIVYRMLPPGSTEAHLLQCSGECVDAARKALSAVVKYGESALERSPLGWRMLLSTLLSLVPFVSFIVLAGNAIATSSSADLPLLSSVVSVMAPVASSSPLVQKIHDACERFRRVANLVLSSASEQRSSKHRQYAGQVVNNTAPPDGSVDGRAMFSSGQPISVDFNFPMAQGDWDSVMTDFESELGSYDPRTLTNIIEPYIANAGW